MAAAEGVRLHHIARETSDVKRLAKFYQEILGFEMIGSPKFRDFEVIWLELPPFQLHIIERNPQSKLPEGPWSSPEAITDPKNLPRGHQLSFAVSNYESFVKTLKERGIEIFEKTQPMGGQSKYSSLTQMVMAWRWAVGQPHNHERENLEVPTDKEVTDAPRCRSCGCQAREQTQYKIAAKMSIQLRYMMVT
eukprot:TRINITY_DN19123_c0_g1_i1.p1 TRINITY_DN19123_c0_g1~~TRINITY_DN19123_c0_g1_i1.p1  ORF type:complete len:192 (+),score=17.74 TRINITY_DN19123_c0_g1_i1:196-771(+)